jgi:uncharacterized short protein YbdD (DUF466 family)
MFLRLVLLLASLSLFPISLNIGIGKEAIAQNIEWHELKSHFNESISVGLLKSYEYDGYYVFIFRRHSPKHPTVTYGEFSGWLNCLDKKYSITSVNYSYKHGGKKTYEINEGEKIPALHKPSPSHITTILKLACD